MSQLGQAQVGTLKSTPKLTRINGDDNVKVIYRNLGNNHAYPFVWATEATISGSDEVVIASGIKWHGYDLASYATVVITPLITSSNNFHVDKDTTNNIIKIKSTATESNGVDFDVMWMLGGDFTAEGLSCRGNTGATQSLP
ncbi:hypothetical protein KAW18_03545 [candidate division WOR-3 bacterium]|nr:hypothetical protein [candidate division WOR-3 bacterium]